MGPLRGSGHGSRSHQCRDARAVSPLPDGQAPANPTPRWARARGALADETRRGSAADPLVVRDFGEATAAGPPPPRPPPGGLRASERRDLLTLRSARFVSRPSCALIWLEGDL